VGDPAPGGGNFSGFHTPGFNNSGEVVFMATTTGAGGGIFLASTTSAPVALALNGAPAPSGGNFSITTLKPDVLINDQHDIVFLANLTGGTADSGYFMRRGPDGPLQTLVLQGDPAPGTAAVFRTFQHTLNNLLAEFCQLGPLGDVAFRGNLPGEGLGVIAGYWHVRTDNTIEKILARGDVAPEFGGGTAVTGSQISFWASGGRYPIWAGIVDGTFENGIFLFVPPSPTNTPAGTTVAVSPIDAVTQTAPVTLTFSAVTGAGNTTATTSAGGPAIPTAFQLGDPPVFYNLTTTAVFEGLITVCIDFAGVGFPAGADLRLLHLEGGAWQDVTTSRPTDTVICGAVTSLSPLTVARAVPDLVAPTLTAMMWLGLKNSDDVGTKFDLLVEVLKNGTVVGSRQMPSVPGGGSGFNNAVLRTVGLSLAAPVALTWGDELGLRVSVRIAATGHRSGTARLWFNDAAASSRVDATIAGIASQFYFTGTAPTLTLSQGTPGAGPRRSVDVTVDRAVGGNPFKPFGMWTLIWP
jgi:hypothetical protein